MNMIDRTTLTVSVNGLELEALRKLSTVCHALATKVDYRASEELKVLVGVLDDLTRQIAINGSARS